MLWTASRVSGGTPRILTKTPVFRQKCRGAVAPRFEIVAQSIDGVSAGGQRVSSNEVGNPPPGNLNSEFINRTTRGRHSICEIGLSQAHLYFVNRYRTIRGCLRFAAVLTI
jgi:hypothetical protein